jgi:EAL domain-containing protein (putative c-di-GMP-specific phosphodiesterase class I)
MELAILLRETSDRAPPHPLVMCLPRLCMYYQPLIMLADGAVFGMEGLARLRDPYRGIVGPAEFIPQLEHAGHAVDVAERVVQVAFDNIRGGQLPGGYRYGFNLPLTILLIEKLPHAIDAARGDFAADDVILELTESESVHDVGLLGTAVERLRGAGYRVVLDDFSPGMRNGAALLDLPFNAIKFGRDVMQLAFAGRDNGFVARSIAYLRGRGTLTIVEGLQTAESWKRSLALGAEGAQGFWIARPMPVEETRAWAERWASGEAAARLAAVAAVP